MVAFLDGNTVWRRKFAEALARANPATRLFLVSQERPVGGEGAGVVPLRMPPGWASRLAPLAMPYLLHRVRGASAKADVPIVLTIPHYLPLARRAHRRNPIVYYCSDDYRSYVGWDAARMARDEAALCRIAVLSIFVSEALRSRAVSEYGLDPARTLVSPNATEPRFAEARTARPEIAGLPGPVFGVAGMFNTRIDTAFLAAIADDPRVGSLALVGPIDDDLADGPGLARLRANRRVHFFGAQPHARMPDWMAAFDVAVIPYAPTALNHFCSPMRLYDHRAIGQPIVATPHCPQIAAYGDVLVGDDADLPRLIGQALAALADGRVPRIESWDMRIDALRKSAVAAVLFAR